MEQTTGFIEYLERNKGACLLEADALSRDDRKDEGVLLRIRANIFDVMIAVSRAAEKQADQGAGTFIKEKMETIPTAWKASLSAAEKHGDQVKAALERVKLQAIADIGGEWARIWETAK